MKHNPIIAIVGKPNVGKSTLFNRLMKKRKAIVGSEEGITRDRNYGHVEWIGREMTLIDTGGYIPTDIDRFNSSVRKQAQLAMGEADLILFMVNGREEPSSSDLALTQFVRESNKPVILVVNKCDSLKQDEQTFLYYELGIDKVLPISALTGRLVGDLLDTVVEHVGIPDHPETEDDLSLRLAIVGMPNVGKSSLTNALLQREQTIVTPVPGTTRDSIDTSLRWYGKEIILVDTAGLRKKSKLNDDIEYYSNIRTHQAISRADVVMVMIDAEKTFGRQDKSIADYVIQNGKGLILLVNKWDLVHKDSKTLDNFKKDMIATFPALKRYPMLFISALTKQRISKIMDLAWNVFSNGKEKIKTKNLNNWMGKINSQSQPVTKSGRLIRIKFVTQIHTQPPTFVFYCNYPKQIPVDYKRFLENRFREAYPFEGIPLRFSFRRK
jgi:GTP-binding protein